MPSKETSTDPPTGRKYRKCCVNWTRLLLPACFPLVIGISTIVYTRQQNNLSRAEREQQFHENEKLRRQTIYDSYISDISARLLTTVVNDEKHLAHIRVKTLNALRHLDLSQKREIVLFLYENCLIRANHTERVDLHGADLTGVKFVRSSTFSCDLNYLYLPEVLANNIIFDGCKLERSVFDGASLQGATFTESLVAFSQFQGANLSRATIRENNLFEANFANADLRYSRFDHNSLTRVNFTNSDLLGSGLPEASLNGRERNIFLNTRFPNGSFGTIDPGSLVMDGSGELVCSVENPALWRNETGLHSLLAVDSDYLNRSVAPVDGNCFFYGNFVGAIYQEVNVHQYSVLIDSGQARYNFSAYFMCRIVGPNADFAEVSIEFRTAEKMVIASNATSIRSDETGETFQYRLGQGQIPAKTRIVFVIVETMIAASPTSSNTTERFCLVDDIEFNIFKTTSGNSFWPSRSGRFRHMKDSLRSFTAVPR